MQRMSRSGQIAIPKHIRQAANIEEGDFIEAELTTEGILLRVLEVKASVRKFANCS